MAISEKCITFANVKVKQVVVMIKIAMYKNDKGGLLVIKENAKGDLIGEVFNNGIEKRGKWDMRATFKQKDGDATEYRVCEHFNFPYPHAWWRKWG